MSHNHRPRINCTTSARALAPAFAAAPARDLAAIALLAATLLLGACTVGPQFQRPAAPPVTVYSQSQASEPPPAHSAQQLVFGGRLQPRWWTLFESAQLDAVVSRAVAGSQTLVAAQAALAQAQDEAAANAGGRYPQVTLSAGAGRQQYGAQFLGSFNLPAFTSFGIGPTVRYTLDYMGGAKRSDEQYAALAQYRRSQVDAAYLALTGNVVMQAVTVASVRAQIQAIEQLIAEDGDNLKLVQTAFAAGSVSRVDVLTAESQQAADETLLPPLRQQLSIARHALSVLSGTTPAQWSPPDFDLARLTLPRRIPVSLPSQLVHQRPDIQSAEAQLHAATAAVGVASANLYPRITLTAGVSQQSLRPEDLFNASSTAWNLLAGLSAPIFDGGTLRAERRAAVDALEASAANYQRTVLQSFGQVADLLDALDHDAQLLQAQSHAVATAQSSLALARESYSAGNTGVLEVLDAQRLREQAQLGLLRAQSQQYLDTAQLLLAMGGGGGLTDCCGTTARRAAASG